MLFSIINIVYIVMFNMQIKTCSLIIDKLKCFWKVFKTSNYVLSFYFVVVHNIMNRSMDNLFSSSLIILLLSFKCYLFYIYDNQRAEFLKQNVTEIYIM